MKIKKTSETTPIQAQVVNVESNSTEDTYSCDYINGAVKDVYSTNEQVVGTWIDGKPLYRKVVNFGALPNNTAKYVAHNIQNLDYIVRFEGMGKRSTDGNFYPINYFQYQDAQNFYSIRSLLNQTNIEINTNSDRSNVYVYIILEYTKTTDIAKV